MIHLDIKTQLEINSSAHGDQKIGEQGVNDMGKRFWISGFVAFLIVLMGGWAVHGMLLTADYMRLPPAMFRTQAEVNAHFPYMVFAYLVLGFAFTWVYRQGVVTTRSWLLQGIRFGIAVALLVSVPMYLIYFVIQPMEGMTVFKQIVGDTVVFIICGIVVAFINNTVTTPRVDRAEV